jgi:hypothetical protein
MLPENFFTRIFEAIDLKDVMKSAINNKAAEISKLVKDQLHEGLNGNGKSLGEYANYEYKGRWSPVDLFLTGNFYKGLAPVTYDQFFEMTDSDSKTEKLTTWYGDAILDLSEEHVETTKAIIALEMRVIYTNEMHKQ